MAINAFCSGGGDAALALRRNQARVRYWIWLTASFKFLIPFSLLTGIGNQFAWRTSTPIIATRLFAIFQEIGRPLLPPATLPASSPAGIFPSLGVSVLGLWIFGLVAVLAAWVFKARHLRIVARAAWTQESGREVDALRRLERRAGSRNPLELRFCDSPLEPGVFGFFRPVLLLPAGISECLDEAQLEAILAHELCHVRSRDNLYAVVQMSIQAIFWFHPFVWWLGGRLVEERERACDEEVLRMGNAPETYAESILKVCKFYLESPLACVSGVTSADLKKRIECIMTQGAARKLDTAKKLLLGIAAAAALAGPIAVGSMNAPEIVAEPAAARSTPMAFRTVSITLGEQPDKPGIRRVWIQSLPDGTFTATNATLNVLVAFAYNVRKHQISGGPDWLNSERYDVLAKAEPAPRGDEVRNMVRTLLTDRFKLKLRHETKELPMFDLVLAKNGPKLREAKRDSQIEKHMFQVGRDHLSASVATMSDLAQILSDQLGRSILDRTGLKGAYDLKLEWNGPSPLTAMQEQLGLKLESRTGPVEILVVDHVEKVPTEN